MIKKLLGFTFAAAVLYGAAWTGAAFWLRAELNAFAKDLIDQSYAITHGGPTLAGFPGAVGVQVRDLVITAPAGHGGWHWEADVVTTRLSLASLTAPTVDLAGGHRVTGIVSAPDEGFTVNVGQGAMRLSFAQNVALENVEVTLSDTSVADATGQTPLFRFKEGALQVSTTTRHAAVSVRAVTLARGVPVLSETIAGLDIALDLTGELPPGPLLASLDAWRDGGGAVELRALTLDWPPARATGTGTLALDNARQPLGAATVKFQGFFEIVAALQEKGLVHAREASVAKTVLGILAKSSPNGAPEIELPLTLQDRKLHAGPIVLMEMPEVVWDENARIP